jgi:hypothetical protein
MTKEDEEVMRLLLFGNEEAGLAGIVDVEEDEDEWVGGDAVANFDDDDDDDDGDDDDDEAEDEAVEDEAAEDEELIPLQTAEPLAVRLQGHPSRLSRVRPGGSSSSSRPASKRRLFRSRTTIASLSPARADDDVQQDIQAGAVGTADDESGSGRSPVQVHQATSRRRRMSSTSSRR